MFELNMIVIVIMVFFGHLLSALAMSHCRRKTAKSKFDKIYLPKIRSRSTPQNEYVPTDGKFESVIRRISRRVSDKNIGPITKLFRGPRIISTSVFGSISEIGIDVMPP